MKLLLAFILYLRLEPLSCQTTVSTEAKKQALEIDIMIKAEFENIQGYAHDNVEFKAFHKFLHESLTWGANRNQQKLKNLQQFQKYNMARLDLEDQLWERCNDLQLKIRGHCYQFYRQLREECVRGLTKSNTYKQGMIEKVKHLICDKMIKGKEADYGYE
ncbi:uncharacterized protein LOC108161553 [Drosophila miranda]|uniref:uncharacterized protein LOC108161553 n=1 Tax=Drosophila miranda TaxID=7229 RepID=UPI0007E7E6D5|nr:uncharacterized protein LOC108161553 [Drosophila miranda]